MAYAILCEILRSVVLSRTKHNQRCTFAVVVHGLSLNLGKNGTGKMATEKMALVKMTQVKRALVKMAIEKMAR